jgi:diguanylate cyclase (GGDEF)-like protein/PAS domain S-box-containing protein
MAEDPLADHAFRGEPAPESGSGLPADLLRSLASVHDAMPVGVAVWTVDGRLARANPVFCDLVDDGPSGLVGRRFDSFVDPLEADMIRNQLRELLHGERNYVECEFRCRRPDGVEHWVTNMLTAIYGASGRPDYLLSQIFDFSNPRTRQARAYRLINETPVLLWLTDRAGNPRIGNRTCFEFVGVVPDTEEDLRSVLLAKMHADDLGDIGESIATAIRDRAPFEFTARVHRADGQWRWLNHRALPFYDAEGEFEGYAGASLDVTEAEELRRQLDDVRELFATVAAAGPFVVLRTDVEGRIVYSHGSWPSVLREVQLVGLKWQDVLSKDQVDEIVTRGLASISSRDPFTVRVRGDHPEGGLAELVGPGLGEVWGELRVAPVFTDDGVHDGFVATLADVSAEVAAGRRADLLARVLDAGSDFLMVAERNGTISYVNDAALHTLGVHGETTEGTPSFLMDVLQPESYEIYREVVEPTLAREQIWRGELNFHSWSGAVIPVSALFIAHESHLGTIESISAVARDITDLKDAERRLRELATHDYLTGLPNRVLLYDRLEQALARFQRHGQAVALLYLDLDRFKPVNDDFGHQVGDAVLIEIADRIHTVIRDTDTAARIGGDEFAVLIEGVEDPNLLRLVADRLIEVMSRPVTVANCTAQVGVSIGLVLAGGGLDASDALMASADAAMYRAKAAGRGRYEFVGPDGLTHA